MSRPPINPEKSLAGIAVDPITLNRIIPESKRSDGTVRKQIKIRPGFTPQEDIRRFRGTKQAQMDANALPKGHIIGWLPPSGVSNAGTTSASGSATSNTTMPTSKAAKKNAKRKEKREKEKTEKEKEKEEVPDNWEDDDEQVVAANATTTESEENANQQNTEDELSSKLDKLQVKID